MKNWGHGGKPFGAETRRQRICASPCGQWSVPERRTTSRVTIAARVLLVQL